MPVTWFQWYYSLRERYEESLNEERGAIAVVASLANVDGLVLADGALNVTGCGAVITTHREVPTVYVAKDALATRRRLRQASPQVFGTRHRSMMRFCNAHPGSIGFVVSQDGLIRAMTKVDDKLIVWENIQTQSIVSNPP